MNKAVIRAIRHLCVIADILFQPASGGNSQARLVCGGNGGLYDNSTSPLLERAYNVLLLRKASDFRAVESVNSALETAVYLSQEKLYYWMYSFESSVFRVLLDVLRSFEDLTLLRMSLGSYHLVTLFSHW